MPKFASRCQAAYVHRLTIWNDRRWCACQAISPANSDASCKGAAPLAETRIRQVRSCALCLIVQPTTGGLRRVATQGCQDVRRAAALAFGRSGIVKYRSLGLCVEVDIQFAAPKPQFSKSL